MIKLHVTCIDNIHSSLVVYTARVNRDTARRSRHVGINSMFAFSPRCTLWANIFLAGTSKHSLIVAIGQIIRFCEGHGEVTVIIEDTE